MNNSKDIGWVWEYGTIAVIDRNTQAVRGWMEVYVWLDVARRSIARSPDFEGPKLVSWGNVTPKEVVRLVESARTTRNHVNMHSNRLQNSRNGRHQVLWSGRCFMGNEVSGQ